MFTWMLSGKIAASSGHAAWISSKKSRDRVFELRGRSDAIVVGGNTVRKDSKYHLTDSVTIIIIIVIMIIVIIINTYDVIVDLFLL